MRSEICLSVVIPAFNAQNTIERTVQSALAWDGDDMELIVVDDGSIDETARLVDKMAAQDSRICVIHKENAGRSVARNVGIANARGDWIMFLDADDFLFEGSLQALRSALANDVDLVIFPVIRSDRAGRVGYSEVFWNGGNCLPEDDLVSAVVVYDYMVDRSRVGQKDRFKLSLVDSNAVWSRLYRHDLILQVAARLGHWPFPEGVRFSEDRIFNFAYLSLMKERDILFSGWPLYFWDLSESCTVSKAKSKDVLNLPHFIRAVDELVACELLPYCDRNSIIAEELRALFWRVERLDINDLGQATTLLNKVVADSDLEEAFASFHIDGLKDMIHFAPPLWCIKHRVAWGVTHYLWAYRHTIDFLRGVRS